LANQRRFLVAGWFELMIGPREDAQDLHLGQAL
jgi:hypothetical protein